MKKPIKIKEIVKKVLKKKGLENKISEEVIKDKWLEIAGLEIYRKTSPGNIKKNKLTVYTENSAWMQELNIKYKKELLEKIKKIDLVSKIKDITFKIKPA
jgi:predicted nucleic acid-binding Zn ribbon protein